MSGLKLDAGCYSGASGLVWRQRMVTCGCWGAVDSEAPNCYEGDSTNHPEEWDDFILWLGPGLTTAEDDCRSPRS